MSLLLSKSVKNKWFSVKTWHCLRLKCEFTTNSKTPVLLPFYKYIYPILLVILVRIVAICDEAAILTLFLWFSISLVNSSFESSIPASFRVRLLMWLFTLETSSETVIFCTSRWLYVLGWIFLHSRWLYVWWCINHSKCALFKLFHHHGCSQCSFKLCISQLLKWFFLNLYQTLPSLMHQYNCSSFFAC